MHSTKFPLNSTYCSGPITTEDFQDGRRRYCLIIFKMADMVATWISERNDFSNSKSPCGPNASHQVWTKSDLGFGSRCGFKIFKMAVQAAILDSQTEAILNLYVPPMLSIKFRLNPTYCLCSTC